MTEPAPEAVTLLLDKVEHISDRGREGLEAWAREFVAAHKRVPGGLTIEVGTRIGGSAALWAGLIELMYPAGRWPPLWTVDPYGSKPYVGGDPHGVHPPIYDAEIYVTMKQNLALVPFHAHWLMTSADFFALIRDASYWEPGEATVSCIRVDGKHVDMPIGIERSAGASSATFILLDGEHSADAIERDMNAAWQWLKPGGVIVVDNVDTDPATLPRLRKTGLRNVARFAEPNGRWLFIYKS